MPSITHFWVYLQSLFERSFRICCRCRIFTQSFFSNIQKVLDQGIRFILFQDCQTFCLQNFKQLFFIREIDMVIHYATEKSSWQVFFRIGGDNDYRAQMHGEIRKARSTKDPRLVTPINGPNLSLGDRCALGSQLRPHIVWFGEEVPMLEPAAAIIARADVLVVVGSSLQVYPAAGLIHHAPARCAVHVIDPNEVVRGTARVRHWKQKASSGVPELADLLLREAAQW